MPFIENCAITDIADGLHHDCGSNSMLIQISDPDSFIPIPKNKFKEIHKFKFLDIDDYDESINQDYFIQEWQAKELVKLLQHALNNDMNVVVHCFAGICRSGAVVEIGKILGFTPVEKFRSPNTRVMRLMMNELGLDYEVKPHNWRDDYRNYLSNKE
jgi:predicted protein tyrosine phosphatase